MGAFLGITFLDTFGGGLFDVFFKCGGGLSAGGCGGGLGFRVEASQYKPPPKLTMANS